MLEKLLRHLPRPVLDRLIALRRAYPQTPLVALPEPVRDEVQQILTSANANGTSPGNSRNPPSPGTILHDGSRAERDEYWKTRQDIAPHDHMREWESSLDAVLEPYKTDTAKREHLAFLRRLLRQHTAQPLDTVEVTAKAIYRFFFQEASGDIEHFARRIVHTNTREEIERNQDLISQLARIYGEQTATRALPLIGALNDAQERRNGSPASLPTLSSVIGIDIHTGRDVTITQRAKLQGVYLIGNNGTGKTNSIKSMAISDIQAGLGVCVVEPHGDLTAQILAGIPRHRLKDVVYLDIEDWEFPFGLNIFEVAYPRNIRSMAATASFIAHTFEVLWSAGFETPRLMQNLRAVTRTLIENPGTTFAEIPLLYSNEIIRAHLLANVTNPQILQFWEDYERMNLRDRRLFTESTLNKVTAFLDEPMIQHILAQSETTINFRAIMDNSKILLIKLSPQFEEASRLIGAVIIGKILMTAFSREDTPEDERVQFNLYCDEFHRFTSSDFATLISEARKFGISTTLSHQTFAQLDERNRASALAAGNLIAFRISGEDAKTLAASYDTTPSQEVIGEEPVRSPVADVISHLVKRGHHDPRVAKFAQSYLQNLEHFVHKPATQQHPQWMANYQCLEGMLTLTERNVHRGREFLNESLYQAMLERRADVQLYTLALYILSVAQGDGREYVLSPYIKGSAGYLREFRDGAERFGHPTFLTRAASWVSAQRKKEKWMAESIVTMITELRYTMQVLSQAPIMVDTGQYQPKYQNRTYQDMENQIARDLANAPNFTAKIKLVNAGEHVIRTQPAPEGLTGHFLAERITAIKRLMQRLGYTRHYTEVMEEIRKRQEFLCGLGNTPDEDAADDRDDPDEPPRGSFTLD